MTTINTTNRALSTQYAAPTTGSTVTLAQTGAPILGLVISPAGTLAALTVALPAGLFDGQEAKLMTTQIVTTLTMTSASGSIVGALASGVANGFASYLWIAAQAKWYRIG